MKNAGRDALIEAAYKSGSSSERIGRAFGLTGARVLQILEERGVPRREYKPPLHTHLDLRRKSA